jgi:hypothetical protein
VVLGWVRRGASIGAKRPQIKLQLVDGLPLT